MASGTLALQHPSDEDNNLDLAQHGSDQDGSNSGGSDEEFDDSKNDFSADGCSDCSSYWMVKDSDERTKLMILKSSDFYRNFNHIVYSEK